MVQLIGCDVVTVSRLICAAVSKANACARFALETQDAGNWPMLGHKLAWGSAELYKTTRDPAILKMAAELGAMLANRQAKDGPLAGTFPYVQDFWHFGLPPLIWFGPGSFRFPSPTPPRTAIYRVFWAMMCHVVLVGTLFGRYLTVFVLLFFG